MSTSSKWTPLIATVIVAVLLGLIRWWYFPEEIETAYGVSYNAERSQLGIPLVENDWRISVSGDKNQQDIVWHKYENFQAILEKEEIEPQHVSKRIMLMKGKRVLERDTYCLKKAGTFYDLTISYDFDTKQWSCAMEIDHNARLLKQMNAEIQEKVNHLKLPEVLWRTRVIKIQDEVSKKYTPLLQSPTNLYFESNPHQQADSIVKSWNLPGIISS